MTYWNSHEAAILGSLGGTGAGNVAPLRTVIAIIDGWDHLPITEAAFTAAAGRLIATGLIGADGTNFWLTETGTPIRRKRGYASEKILIGLRQFGIPYGDPLVLPEGAWDRAYAEYRADPDGAVDDRLRRSRRMTDPGLPQWTYNDALLLGSLGGTGADDTASLRDMIGVIDFRDRGVLNEEDFVAAAGRLIATGLVGVDGTNFWLTGTGAPIREARGYSMDKLLIGLRKVGRPHGEPYALPKGAYNQAWQEYHTEFMEIIERTEPGPSWRMYDAPVFLAISENEAERVPLLSVITTAYNGGHSWLIPEWAFSRTAGRLIAAGLIDTDGSDYWLTDAGRQFRADHGSAEGDIQSALYRTGMPTGEPIALAAGIYQQALDEVTRHQND